MLKILKKRLSFVNLIAFSLGLLLFTALPSYSNQVVTGPFDAVARLPNGKTYVTQGDQYWRYSDNNGTTVDSGYPKPIAGNWGDLPESFNYGFDAIETLPNGKTYVFSGDQYVRYSDTSASTVDSGYPKPIRGNWGNIPDSFNDGVDAMVTLPNGKIYLVKEDQYVRYSDPSASTVDSGYPKPIAGNWGDLPESFNYGFDAMAVLPNEKTYIAVGDQYVRYSDPSSSTVDSGYPKPIGGYWGHFN